MTGLEKAQEHRRNLSAAKRSAVLRASDSHSALPGKDDVQD